MSEVTIDALTVDEAQEAWDMAHASLHHAGRKYGWHMPDADAQLRERGRGRLLHALSTDPDGAWAAHLDDQLVGVAVATRRESLWFLSLLAVATGVQSRGIGARLLAAAKSTMGSAGVLCASDDPKALRRYRAAGFALTPCYQGRGRLDRSTIPAVDGVRRASLDDRDFIEDVARLQRTAPHGADLDYWAAMERPFYVTDTSAGRGYVLCSEVGAVVLGATTPRAAQSLLWTALAESTAEEVEQLWVQPSQSWAIDVLLGARLSLKPTGTLCTQGSVGPMSPYIPNGAFG